MWGMIFLIAMHKREKQDWKHFQIFITVAIPISRSGLALCSVHQSLLFPFLFLNVLVVLCLEPRVLRYVILPKSYTPIQIEASLWVEIQKQKHMLFLLKEIYIGTFRLRMIHQNNNNLKYFINNIISRKVHRKLGQSDLYWEFSQ